MHILLLLIIGVFVALLCWLLIAGITWGLKARRYFLDMRDVFSGQPPRSTQSRSNARKNTRNNNAGQQTAKPVHKKKIDPTVGEYIEFQEISCTVDATDNQGNRHIFTQTEQQIVDAEWEDLK